MNKNRNALFFLFVLVSTVLCDNDTVTVQLKWLHQFQFAGYYAAIEKGYYEEEGLYIKLRERDMSENFIDPVIKGSVEYGISDISLISYYLHGAPVVLLTQVFQHSPYALITLKNSNIISPLELKGKTVALDQKSISDAPIVAMLSQFSSDIDSFVYTIPNNPANNTEKLLSGEIDAMTCYLSNEPYTFREKGININIINPQSYGIDLLGDNLFTTREEIRDNPERVEKMIRATLRGWEYALAHPDEICTLIYKEYTQEHSIEKLQYEASIIQAMIVPNVIPLGTTSNARYRRAMELYKNLELLERDSIPADFFYRYKREATEILTPKEREWLNEHDSAVFALDSNWLPLIMRDGKDKWAGMYVDYLKIINEKLGSNFQLKPGKWGEIIQSVNNREGIYDVLMATGKMSKKDRFLNYTKSYTTSQKFVIMKQKDKRKINSLKDLVGLKVAIGKGWSWEKRMLLEADSAIEIIELPPNERFNMLLSDSIDAYIANYSVFYALNEFELALIQVAHIPPEGDFPLHLGVRGDMSDTMITILNKAIDHISPSEMRKLSSQWMSIHESIQQKSDVILELSEDEQQFLKDHPTIRIGFDPSWPPMEFSDKNGTPVGISISIIKEIEKSIGIEFVKVSDVPWDSLITLAKNRELDGFACISQTEQRNKFLTFTKPYLSFPVVIFTRNDINYLHSLRELKGKKIALIKGFALVEWIRRDFPDLEIVLYSNINDALKGVAQKEVDAYVDNLLSGSYALKKLGLNNIKVSGETKYKNDLRIGIRSDWPILRSIIQKAIDAIPEEKKDKLTSRWQNVEYTTTLNYRQIMQIVVPLIVILFIILLWNRGLKKEVLLRKEAEYEAEKANRAKSIFLANMSHEIRTPLNAIIGFSHILKNTTKDEQAQYYGKLIAGSGDTLLALINDILDLSKIEAEKLTLSYAPTSMQSLADEVKMLFDSTARGKGIGFSVTLSPPSCPELIIDEVRLRQVILNLCSNAIKFTEEGEVAVSLSVTLDQQTKQASLHIAVQDSGCGIAEDQQHRIFDAFAQSEGQSVDKYGGTGLGLAISKKLITMMGGTISVESVKGQGSTFTCFIPEINVNSDETATAHHDRAEQYRFEPASILIVDDIELNREVLRGLLVNQPFTFLEAENGTEAYKIALEKNPDCILMDIKMPEENGDVVAQRLREKGFTNPIIAISASVLKDEAERVKEVCDDFLQKPIDPPKLNTTLATYLTHTTEEATSPQAHEKAESAHLQLPRESRDFLKEYIPLLQEILNSLAVDEISSVAANIRETAEKHSWRVLTSWSNSLYDAAELFDIEKCTTLIRELLHSIDGEQDGKE